MLINVMTLQISRHLEHVGPVFGHSVTPGQQITTKLTQRLQNLHRKVLFECG